MPWNEKTKLKNNGSIIHITAMFIPVEMEVFKWHGSGLNNKTGTWPQQGSTIIYHNIHTTVKNLHVLSTFSVRNS